MYVCCGLYIAVHIGPRSICIFNFTVLLVPAGTVFERSATIDVPNIAILCLDI